ncbi:hypothetical protein HDV01_001166 [Terramyces sp. JEL0728]|nr:hypothetical protein HDV01_001166 [Terramyces sp. JEL0728]
MIHASVAVATTVSSQSATSTAKVDCGYTGVTSTQCASNGCCWDPISPNPSNVPWCYKCSQSSIPAVTSTIVAANTSTTDVATVPIASATAAPTTANVQTTLSPATQTAGTVPSNTVVPVLTGCNNFNGHDSCVGNNIEIDPSQDVRAWQTPNRNSSNYKPTYQDYSVLTGHAHVVYNSGMQSATVSVLANSKMNLPLQYSFDGGKTFSTSSSQPYTTTQTSAVNIQVIDPNGAQLVLDPVDLVWSNVAIPNISQFKNGQFGAIVDLFGWKWTEVEAECPMLAKAGYLGVKIHPPNEHVTSDSWLQDNNVFNIWYFIYQPVSYRLHSRFGTRAELRKMIQTCRSLGVRVYADAVVNHMSGGGNDIQNHRNPGGGNSCATWGPKSGTDNSPFFTQWGTYMANQNGQYPGNEFPSVPYFPSDFHCERTLGSWTDPIQLDAGWLSGLLDLNTGHDRVQERIADLMTDYISIGFSGFRFDAAKQILPASIAKILAKVKRNLGGALPADFLTWLEVILGGEKDILACDGTSSINFYQGFDNSLAANGFTAAEISQIKIWSSDYPKEMPICGNWILPPSRFVIQNDDHDQQNAGSSSRDMQSYGSVLIKDKNLQSHRNFELLLFNRRDNDWAIKVVLSSFSYGPNNENGFLDGLSDCALYKGNQTGCKSCPNVAAHDSNACGYSCFDNGGGWIPFMYTRVHRDRQIINAMRSWVGLPASSDLGIPSSCT